MKRKIFCQTLLVCLFWNLAGHAQIPAPVSAWLLNNASTTDSADSNTLTAHGSPGSASGGGVCTEAATSFGGSADYFEHANASNLQTGPTTWAFSTCVKLASKSTLGLIAGRYSSSSGAEYIIFYDNSADRFKFELIDSGSNGYVVTANNFGSPTVNTFYWLVGTFTWVGQTSSNTMTLQVCDTMSCHTADSFSFTPSATITAETITFDIGVLSSTTPTDYWNGSISNFNFWKGTIPSSANFTTIWNGGNVLAYPFTGGTASSGSPFPLLGVGH